MTPAPKTPSPPPLMTRESATRSSPAPAPPALSTKSGPPKCCQTEGLPSGCLRSSPRDASD
eukprot:1277666-Pyramimonas_sp.AAC.1